MDKDKLQLNLGCFKKKIYGFINVDCRAEVEPDVVDDIRKLDNFKENSTDIILSVHALEHLKRAEIAPTLKRWYDVLKTGGKAYIAVPDMRACFELYFYCRDLKIIYSSLGGSQVEDHFAEDIHLSHFDFDTLKEHMENAGFKDVKLYDHWKTPWAHNDNYSAAYYPCAFYPPKHAPFQNKLISLNMEGTK